MPSAEQSRPSDSHGPFRAAALVCLGVLLHSFGLQSVLEAERTATTVLSGGLWRRVVLFLGGEFTPIADGRSWADIGVLPLFLPSLCVAIALWLMGAWWLARRRQWRFGQGLAEWGRRSWPWWTALGLWELARLTAFLLGLPTVEMLIAATPQLWAGLAFAGWLATFLTLSHRPGTTLPECRPLSDDYRIPVGLWVMMGVYLVVFTTMNWQLYRGLLIPHGDSAMYEEHLWNLTHGKGFRSYLDQGLFLGEHVQVIHLLLIPLHWLWPSHLLLELCESAALAAGAIPVYWMARRHTGCTVSALALGAAYLLYVPMQYLDIAIDLKTFRPISFGVPLFLLALDAMERGKTGWMAFLLLLTLAAKEDYALVLAPLGIWIAFRSGKFRAREKARDRRSIALGIGMAAFGIAYLLLVTRVVIPWFRDGVEVHYARYFARFGDTLTEIGWTMVSRPGLLLGELFTVTTALYGLVVLVPVAFIPLLSPGRFLVGTPLFGLLCLNELSQNPHHHFHAPLVPILFWAAAGGLSNVVPVWQRIVRKRDQSPEAGFASASNTVRAFASHLIWASALAVGFSMSLSPLGLSFWDPYSFAHCQRLYVPGERVKMFAKVFDLIPREARVASTDFIHPRFTHHARSYDYSGYARKVGGGKPGAPDDTDYIVIDTRHYYSDFKTLDDIPEYRDHPKNWEVLPDNTAGYFVILKRIRE